MLINHGGNIIGLPGGNINGPGRNIGLPGGIIIGLPGGNIVYLVEI